MNVLITGVTGFVGRNIFEVINQQSGKNITVLSRAPVPFFSKQVLVPNFGGDCDFSQALKGCEVVIHCAARVHIMNDALSDPLAAYREVNTVGTINLARQASEAGIKRFIFISSIKVNGEVTELGYPFKSTEARSPKDFYGQSKSEAEEQLLQLAGETGLEVVIIRPTLVYGPGVKANFSSLMNLVSKGLPLPFGCITQNKRSLVSVANLIDLIVTCIDHPKAINQVFLVSDDHDVSTSEMVREMAKSLNKYQWQIPIPKWCYQLAGYIFDKQDIVDRLLGSLQVDITHTKETLGWKPPQSLEDGFNETAQEFLKLQKK